MIKEKKFTLVELMVVVAIIGILVSLLFPSLGRARNTARTAQCMSSLHQIGLGVRMYLSDNNRKYSNYTRYYGGPYYLTGDVTSHTDSSNPFHFQVPIDKDYTHEKEFYICPSSKKNTKEASFKADYTFNTEMTQTAYRDLIDKQIINPASFMHITDTESGWLKIIAPQRIDVRHEGQKLNHLWADGHVSSLKYNLFFNNAQWLTPNGDRQVSFSGSFTIR